MTDRPTPEQCARGRSGHELLTDLRDLGYIIAHPDDVPQRKPDSHDAWTLHWHHGWNSCRRHIFGGDQ